MHIFSCSCVSFLKHKWFRIYHWFILKKILYLFGLQGIQGTPGFQGPPGPRVGARHREVAISVFFDSQTYWYGKFH